MRQLVRTPLVPSLPVATKLNAFFAALSLSSRCFHCSELPCQDPEWLRLEAAAIAVNRLGSSNPSELAELHACMVRTHLLRGPFHWNALMRRYLRLAEPWRPLQLFIQMTRFPDVLPDCYTFPIVFKAVSQLYALPVAQMLQAAAIKHGLNRHEFTESGLINVYAKAGEFDCALKVFDDNPQRKLGSWNAIISGLAQGGRLAEAIDIFMELRRIGFVPDDVTMVSVVSASAGLGDLGLAQQVHKCLLQADRSGRLNVMTSNSLVDMYSKCGRTDLAYLVFSRMAKRDVSSWTSMIMGLAMHGEELAALNLFQEMQQEGVQPNGVTFVGVLSACAHKGLIDEGMHYLEVMARDYGLKPTVAHYGCVVDMLGRVGRLEEAQAVVNSMPMEANVVIWGTLLGACEKHLNVVVGEWSARKLLELEPWNDGVYVVLSNIYAGLEMWEEVQSVRKLMRERRVAKGPGYSLATAIT